MPPPKVREGDDAKHRAAVSRLPCVSCGREEPSVVVDPHHLLRAVPAGSRGMRLTAPDRYALPLCRACHSAVHDDKRSDDEQWLAERGVDGRSICEALWRVRGDAEAMRRVVERSLLTRGVHA